MQMYLIKKHAKKLKTDMEECVPMCIERQVQLGVIYLDLPISNHWAFVWESTVKILKSVKG